MKLLSKLKSNIILPIYTDYKEEENYEGDAILIEKIRDGDTFYLKNESVKVDEKKKYSKIERLKLEKYNRLKYFFYGKNTPPDKELVKLRKELTSLRKDQISDYEKMYKLLEKYKEEYKDSPRKIKSVLTEFDNDYIIRFINQDNRTDWNPTLYTYERWKVKFIKDTSGWDINFVTQRNIRIVRKINPKENGKQPELTKFTTYNYGKPSIIPRDGSRSNNKKPEKSKQNIIDDDEQFDKLINNKILWKS